MLERYKEEVVSYPSPPSEGSPIGITRKKLLIDSIAEWLSYLGLVESVVTNDLGKIGYELKVKAKGVEKELDLTNVGL